ncbi:MAG: peptidoglycan binding protein CsiV [Gammaproteobacteria bacterium]|nr:peptidoglycan binding protein CsiV [Gammaproteobacteria bacterium]MBT8109903.1 peptidoglycan binding protein CsiV [Gammaproteobacteria bacterium]NND47533.1 hypothetical protein [Woeseiaceae bacterium]NNL44605.1 hypothetical protein [Woeseiaceae bacterium]
MKTAAMIGLVFLPFVAAQSQDDIAGEEQEIRRYAVEVIIFKYAQEVAPGSEIFPADEPILEDPGQEDDSSLFGDEPLEEIPRRFHDIELTRLTESEYTMNETMDRLERLDVYDPVMHFGWSQATWPEEYTRPIEIGSMGRLPEGLSGTLKLYLSRFLHLVVDLQLDAPESANRLSGRNDAMSGYGDSGTFTSSAEFEGARPIRYRINEDRIFRSGELRYFDHPKFGMLAKVTRVEEEEPEPAEPDDTELLGYPPD